MSTDQSTLILREHVESTTNYNKEMEEKGLATLGEGKEEDVSVDDLLGDIDSR